MFKGTRWKSVIRSCAGNVHRELKISLARPASPEKWVFVVGCYNSGTTLLRQVLASHPLISALPEEGQYLTDQLPSDHELGLSRMWVEREDLYRLNETSEGPDVLRLKKEWGSRLDRSKPIFLDQTPANSARTRWLQKHFAPAYFIAVVRNGYAVAEGIRRKAQPIHRRNGWPIEMAARQWRRANEILLEESQCLDRILWVAYEKLCDEPNLVLNEVAEFLGVDIAKDLDLSSAWSVHERSQAIQNLNAVSLQRLTSDDIRAINDECVHMLQHFKYPVLNPAHFSASHANSQE